MSEKNKDKIPYTTDENGNYDDRGDSAKDWNMDDGLNWWTNGFWGGIMWLLYQDTKDERYIAIARNCGRKLKQTFAGFYGLHHDCDAVVQNCTGAYHDSRHHFTMVYADYFYIEAVYKLNRTGIFMW